MDAQSGYRLSLTIALVFVLWLMVPYVVSYVHLVTGGPRPGDAAAFQVLPEFVTHNGGRPPARGVAPGKLSVSGLELALAQSRQFPVTAQMHCVPYGRSWDYLCSFSPKPSQPHERLQFGVIVDSTRWLKVSSMVPASTPVPAPQ